MMQKALFLDRDGVINFDKDDGSFTFKEEDFVINPDVVEVLAKATEKNFLIIVITNQSGIGKGLYDHSDVNRVHKKLRNALLEHNILLTEIYYCPHHPSTSNCICRKPDCVMIQKALARFNIDPTRSIFVGDKERDSIAARSAGIQNVYQIKTNSSLKQIIHLLDQ